MMLSKQGGAEQNMTPALDDEIAELRRANTELRQRLDERTAELELRTAERDEAQAQQTATAQVLGVINSSPGDLAPVFDAILEKAMRLCETTFGHLMAWDGERLHRVAFRGMPEALVEEMRQPIKPVPGSFLEQVVQGKDLICHTDLQEAEAGSVGPGAVSLMRFGARARAMVALRKDERLLGTITVYRTEVRPFTDKQIALLQNFAAQAVIAMENARLLGETREALEQQTATAEVLQVINASPGDLTPVFHAMLEKATELCEAAFGVLRTWDGERFHFAAAFGNSRLTEWARKRPPFTPERASILGRIVGGESLVTMVDALSDKTSVLRELAEVSGMRSVVTVALRKYDALVGSLTVYRQEVRPFSDKQIGLLQNFAAQAVIAMENARLITETREALEQQTATTEVLQVINS
jgi:GAF domain-containing protein